MTRVDVRMGWVLCAIAGLAGAGLGGLVPLVSSHLERVGSDPVSTGGLATLYFAAQSVGALWGQRVLGARLGLSALALGLLIASGATLVFPYLDGYASWSLNRVIAGLAMGLYLTTAQLLVMQLDTEHRGRLTALYSLAFGVGFSLGPALSTQAPFGSETARFILPASALGTGALLSASLP